MADLTENDYFDDAVEYVFKNEGGLCNDAGDPGGLTNFGISHKTYPNVDIRHLTRDKAKAIYRRDYWEPYFWGYVDDRTLAIKLMDFGVNAGTGAVTRMILHIVNQFHSEGTYAGWTQNAVAALNTLDPKKMLERVIEKEIEYYNVRIAKFPNLRQFRSNWISRAKRIPEPG